jgi:CubicO group peptidase (beta-lactamase class C family)
MRRVSVLILLLCGSSLGAQADPTFQAEWEAVVREYHELLDQQGIVGSSIMFMHRGRVIGQAFHGHADLETNRAVDKDTIYHWASITKTFTGIAILQLRDRGLLSLDDPIVRYLPELRQIHDPEGQVEGITIAHLLSHSSGFRDPTFPWGNQDWHPHEPTRWEQIVAMLPYTRLQFEPGSRFGYSNPGYIFLGRVIEILSGEDFEVYVDKNVLRPLGMTGSYFDHTPYHLLKHRSNNYTVKDGERIANGLDFDTGITVSNGGLNAPLPDMVKYLAFLTDDSREPAQSVLSRASLESMWKPLNPMGEIDDIETSMGLSYFILDTGSSRFIGHTGGQKAFISLFYIHPETHTAVIAAFNTLGAGKPPQPDTRAILATLRAKLFSRVFPLFTID